jgi:hypothetical protein
MSQVKPIWKECTLPFKNENPYEFFSGSERWCGNIQKYLSGFLYFYEKAKPYYKIIEFQ